MKAAKLLALILVLTLLAALLTACGNTAMTAAAGTYEGQYLKLVGDETKIEDPFSLTLKADGTGTHSRDGLEYSVTWTLEGETFTMAEKFLGITNDYTGTLKDGALHLYNGDPSYDFTYEFFYQKK